MTEVELLRKIAKTAIAMRNFKTRYDIEMREYARKYPLADLRHSRKAVTARKEITDPIYDKFKESKRQLEGYLFMFECKEWVSHD